ncbi:MAG: DUF805 domain-containing protein [Asticcacaulis sp.]|nr:DUF805 domain-containing protein [Asticcacaulis sp.]
MISLAWDTRGRLGRQAYKDATGGLSLTWWAGLILGALFVVNFTKDNIYTSSAVVAGVMIVLVYLQYRYAQLSIKRLHDRGLSGLLYAPMLMFTLIALAYGGYALVKIMYAGGFFSLVYNLPGLIEPYVQVFFYKGMGLWLTALVLFYWLYISWSLGARGLPRDNRYGPATEG